MATKKILVSDGSGSTQELRTSNIGYDDVANRLSASAITAYNLSSSLQTGVLLANGNFISSSVVSATGGSGSLLQFSGSTYTLNLPTAIGGDLSGSTTALDNVKVISVANVNSGTLPFAHGGTGLSSEISGVLIKGAGDTLQVLNTADTGSVIGLGNDGWFIDNTDPTTNYVRRVDVYAGAAGNGLTWTKKGNPRFIDIIIVGGGGGGGSGGKTGLPNPGGAGGAGGGFTFVTIEAANISSGIITIGQSGSGGAARTATTGLAGTAGGITSFTSSLGYFYATGGGSGAGMSPTSAIGGTSGGGNGYNTQAGGNSSVPGAAPTAPGSRPGGGGINNSGGGAGGGGTAPPFSNRDGAASGVILNSNISASGGLSSTASPGSSGVIDSSILPERFYLNNSSVLTTNAIAQIFGTGGGGGGSNFTVTSASAGSGGDAKYGSGGGGGGNLNPTAPLGTVPTAFTSGRGGNGGEGFVIIKSY